MWRVLGNNNEEAVVAPRKQPTRTVPTSAPVSSPRRAVVAPKLVILCGRYRVTGLMRKGATGFLYKGVIVAEDGSHLGSPGSEVVLKVEDCAAPRRQMKNEWQVYQALKTQRISTQDSSTPLPPLGVGGFPRAEFDTADVPLELLTNLGFPSLTGDGPLSSNGAVEGGRVGIRSIGNGGLLTETMGAIAEEGQEGCRPMNILAMECLGENLATLAKACRGGCFTLQTTLRLGVQMVGLLRMLHSAGYVHRDIKPENFCVGRGSEADNVFLIDYGLACPVEAGRSKGTEAKSCSTSAGVTSSTIEKERTRASSGVESAPPPGSPQQVRAVAAVSEGGSDGGLCRRGGATGNKDENPAAPRSLTTVGELGHMRGGRGQGGETPTAVAGRPNDLRSRGDGVVGEGGEGGVGGSGDGIHPGPSNLVGSVRYLSILAHRGGRQTRHCDLESLGYVMLYLVRGRLPWQGLTARTKEAHMEKIRASKAEQSPEQLCKGLPALAEYLLYVRGLGPSDVIDYDKMIGFFSDGLRRRGFSQSGPFDWRSAPSMAVSGGGIGPGQGVLGMRGTGLTIGGAAAVSGAGTGSSVSRGSAMQVNKRPRLVGGSGALVGTSHFARGRRPLAASAAVGGLYADVPPPEARVTFKLPGDEEKKDSDETSGNEVGEGGGRGVMNGDVESVSTVTSALRSSIGAVGKVGSSPVQHQGEKSKRVVALGCGQVSGGEDKASVVGGKASDTGGQAVDAIAALSKLRPHLKTDGKKLARACALLTDLLAAKLDASNEEAFHSAMALAIRGDEAVSSGCAAHNAVGRSPVGGAGAGGGREASLESVPRRLAIAGPVGSVVRRLVATALERVTLFQGQRRQDVELWGSCGETESQTLAAVQRDSQASQVSLQR